MTHVAEKPRIAWRRQLVRLLAFVVFLYLVVTILFASLQRSLMYPAFQSGPLPASKVALPGVEATDLATTTADGLTLHGWRLTPGNDNEADRPVILFLHGNGGNRAHRLDDVDILTGLGAEVVLFDYRGYGENAGSPTEEGLAADARAIWKFATGELGVPPGRIVLFGESLGGGVAVRLAGELEQAGTPPGGVILRSTFSSMIDAASHHYPWLPIRLALLDRYESIDRIGGLSSPLLFLHGDADNVVPLELGRRLFEAAPAQSASGIARRFALLPGAGHNDVLGVARDAYRDAIEAFLHDLQQPSP